MANRAKSISSKTAYKIRELRNRVGLTQKELAEKLHKSESAVRMWELGKSEPDLQSINELSAIFNVSVDYIIGEEDTPSQEEALKLALFGGGVEVTDEMWQEVISFANYVKEKHKKGDAK